MNALFAIFLTTRMNILMVHIASLFLCMMCMSMRVIRAVQSNRAAAKAVQGRVEVGWLPHNLRKQQAPLNVAASLTIENLVSSGIPWMSLDLDRFPFESIGMHAIHDYLDFHGLHN